jgi:hypothetical protein
LAEWRLTRKHRGRLYFAPATVPVRYGTDQSGTVYLPVD